MDITKTNQQTYDALAKEYDQKAVLREAFNTKVIKKFTQHINAGKKILDIGCAVGLDTSIFTKLGFQPIGIELSGQMVERAKKRNPDALIIHGEFMEHRFDQKFDAIFAQAFIHLFPKVEVNEVLRRIYKLLNDEGVALITTSKSENSQEGWFVKEDYSGKQKRFRKHWTESELKQALKQAKFKVIDFYTIEDPYKKLWMVATVGKR